MNHAFDGVLILPREKSEQANLSNRKSSVFISDPTRVFHDINGIGNRHVLMRGVKCLDAPF